MGRTHTYVTDPSTWSQGLLGVAAGLSRRNQKWTDGFESRWDRNSSSVIELELKGVMTWRLLYEVSP
jgi:hypothetical protein